MPGALTNAPLLTCIFQMEAIANLRDLSESWCLLDPPSTGPTCILAPDRPRVDILDPPTRVAIPSTTHEMATPMPAWMPLHDLPWLSGHCAWNNSLSKQLCLNSPSTICHLQWCPLNPAHQLPAHHLLCQLLQPFPPECPLLTKPDLVLILPLLSLQVVTCTVNAYNFIYPLQRLHVHLYSSCSLQDSARHLQ